VDNQLGGDPYSLRGLVEGNYYIFAVIDFNGSGGPPDSEDIISFYDPNQDGEPDPISITSGSRITGIDFEISGATLYLPLVTK